MSRKIVLTGGGTAGHVTPNLALLPHLQRAGYEVYYIGSIGGMEKKMIEDSGIPYLGIETGNCAVILTRRISVIPSGSSRALARRENS